MSASARQNGGEIVAEVLSRHGVRFLFTLCGGHISPILVGCKRRGIRVVDTRHEVTAAFAADAVARLSGVPGVAAVTAGPGVTNTITALKNAQMAQSPLVLLGGATATLLKGRGSLQDIDQLALVRPHVKWAGTAKRVRDLEPLLERAFREAASGIKGPVFLECPVDLLYDEAIVREMYAAAAPRPGSGGLVGSVQRWYLGRYANKLLAPGAPPTSALAASQPEIPLPSPGGIQRAAELLRASARPLLLVGSQTLAEPAQAGAIAGAIAALGVPVYLAGVSRGLLGRDHPLQLRHQRKLALREADCVILAGVPCDFRLDYGRQIAGQAVVIAANRDAQEMRKNRRPSLAIVSDAGAFLRALALAAPVASERIAPWREALRGRERDRDTGIDADAAQAVEAGRVHPLRLCRELELALGDDSVLVADGGDFVATASYTVRPRGPLSWLDPGVFGTLGCGAGFALGAKLVRPEAEVWVLWGDGAFGYSLAEYDTFVRHGLPVIGVVGNDAGWTQIAREQIPMLGDAVGTELAATDYERVVEGFGGQAGSAARVVGLSIRDPEQIAAVFAQAKAAAAAGSPVLVNAHLGKTEFRKGSLSM
jgi:acetolactate synthase-like protein